MSSLNNNLFEDDQRFVSDKMSIRSPSLDQNSLFRNDFSEDQYIQHQSAGTLMMTEHFLNLGQGNNKPMSAYQSYSDNSQGILQGSEAQLNDHEWNISSGSDEEPPQNPLRNQNLNDILKNFLVILSIWMRNFFIDSFEKSIISQEVYQRFERLVCRRNKDTLIMYRRKGGRKQKHYRKVYINLKILSQLFSEDLLNPCLTHFFDSYILRYLMTSKTEHKQELLRFLPVLKRGLVEGKITNLR